MTSRVLTGRLVLEPLDVSLAAAITGGVRGPDWASGFPTEGDRLVAGLLVAAGDGSSGAPAGQWGPWTLRLASGGTLIGGAGFHGPPASGEVEVGYGIAVEHRGQGLAREAVAALVDLARSHGVQVVRAHVVPGNRASLRLLAALGFVPVTGQGADGRDGELTFVLRT